MRLLQLDLSRLRVEYRLVLRANSLKGEDAKLPV